LAREALCAMPAAGLLHGEVSAVEQDYRWVRPLRFCDEQLRTLGSCQAWHPGLFRQMARTTAGVCVEFETDAREVALEVRVDGEPKGTRAVLEAIDRGSPTGPDPHDGISASVDGRHVWCGMPEQDLVVLELAGHDPEDSLGLVPLPGMERTRHVRIWLPALRGAVVRDVICDGSFVRPVARRRQLLALGDSIVQGFVSGDPSFSWPALLAARLDLDLVNQGVGGQVFQPGSLFGLAGYTNPARIIVAFGENYRYEPCVARRVSLDIRGYLGEVHRLWPQVPVHVLTPLWHDEEAYPSHAMSCFEHVPDLIAAQVESFENMTLLDGLELLEHDAGLLADGFEHPNERGCRQIATRINAVMRVPGLRPSSVGKRRKPRKRPVQESKAPEAGSAPLPLDGIL
jgi:hypothetical protein